LSGRIVVSGVGKVYSTYRSEWRRFAHWLGLGLPRDVANFTALEDVSFEVGPGEAVALVGQNGAGKSTLLKIVAGTVAPTRGTVHREGRIAAILELGMGFSPDFTGRRNAEHGAGLLGHSSSEIARRMPEIEAFAELGDFFDRPLRTYSSGMQVRLAFAVATAFVPDVLIVDEALSVGDAYFQAKSFHRIRQLLEGGTTLLFVSHDPSAVRKLCTRAVLLEAGRIALQGTPDQVVDYYNAMLSARDAARRVEQDRRPDGWLQTRSGSGEATVESIQLSRGESDEAAEYVTVGEPARISVQIHSRAPIPRLVLGLMIRDRTGHVVWGTNTHHTEQPVEFLPSNTSIRIDYDFTVTLGPGVYSVSPALVDRDTHLERNYDWTDNMLVFEVVNTRHPYFIGSNWLDGRFTVREAQPL
jgi:lipopolysaccharide transport system ATP-binding protein